MESFLQNIANKQNQYYAEHGKNTIFKKNQKQDCAEMICQTIGINELVRKTAYIIPETNKVYFDYTIFKTYATIQHFEAIVDYTYSLCMECLKSFDTYEVHVNLLSFTISAYDRYKDLINLFCNRCVGEFSTCPQSIQAMHIYNCPHVIDQVAKLAKPMISPLVSSRTHLHLKSEGLPSFIVV